MKWKIGDIVYDVEFPLRKYEIEEFENGVFTLKCIEDGTDRWKSDIKYLNSYYEIYTKLHEVLA